MQHAGLFDDDGQIDDLMIVRSEIDREYPRVSIQLSQLSPRESSVLCLTCCLVVSFQTA